MSVETISYNKSMQYRLEEYQQLLDGIDTPCSEITEIWASIFEDLVIIGANWQALWKLSEQNCMKYELLYPTAVIVNVENFHWRSLTATVKVLAVQEDIVLPSLLEVPIIELHPLKVQEYDETDLRDIEDWLDKCRFFFQNLWYPWDAKINGTMMDWCESHLKNRLKMQYDMKNGIFDRTTANYLKSLLAEAQKTISSDIFTREEDEKLTIVKKYIRRKMIKTELNLFEEPELRYGMILLKKKERNSRNSNGKFKKEEIIFVWRSGTCQSLIHYLQVTQSLADENCPVRVCSSLQGALDSSCTNDVIVLPPGVHAMTSLKGIDSGLEIKGLSKSESVIVSDSSFVTRAILFESYGCLTLENLTISKSSGIAIQVFRGDVKITNCTIVAENSSITSKGIVVISGSKLFMEDCKLEGFGTGIVVQPSTRVSILNTKITDCYEGIKVADNASLSLHCVEISNSEGHGIRVESSEIDSEVPLAGDLNLLNLNNLNCNIKTSAVTFYGNKKGDVLIKKREGVFLYEEPSESESSDEVICISDEERTQESFDKKAYNKAL